MKKAGRELEELVAAIERLLGVEGKVTVESPGFLTDKSTGQRREHDVLLTVVNAHHTTLIAIECRDRSRPIGVPDVEAFALKCRETSVHQGVMVSSRGYRKTALKKAKAHDIRCLSLEGSSGFNWLGTDQWTQSSISVNRIHVRLNLPAGRDVSKAGATLVGLNGEAMPMDAVYKAVRERAVETIMGPQRSEMDSTGFIRVNIECAELSLRDDESGELVPLESAYGLAEYSIVEHATELRLQSYVDAATGHLITQAAHADLGPLGAPGRLLMLNRNAEGGVVAFVPHKVPQPAGAMAEEPPESVAPTKGQIRIRTRKK